MEYLLIIHNDPQLHPKPGTPAWEELMAGYYAFGAELKALGIEYKGDPLADPGSATTVRIRDGKKIVTDGPFAETKEWFSGYYRLQCKDLNQALELAAKIPSAKCGSVEVRPVMDMTAHAKR